MENITVVNVITICSWIVAIAAVVKLVKGPIDKVNKRLSNDDKRIEENTTDISELKKDIEVLLECNLAILNHMAYGNHTADMKSTISKLNSHLVKKD